MQKMLTGHLTRVISRQVYENPKIRAVSRLRKPPSRAGSNATSDSIRNVVSCSSKFGANKTVRAGSWPCSESF